MDIIGTIYTCDVQQLRKQMNTYFIRCIQADYSRLLTLGEKLGAITLTYTEFVENTDENGIVTSTPTGTLKLLPRKVEPGTTSEKSLKQVWSIAKVSRSTSRLLTPRAIPTSTSI